MFAHLSLQKGLAGDVQREEVKGFVDQALPELRKLKGFKDAYVLQGDVMAIFSLWETEADQKASGSFVDPAIDQLVARRKIATPERYVFEVAAHALDVRP
jgi:heme-degrading monooxygenase HmoA